MAIQIAEDVFNLTKSFPINQTRILTDQMQRSAISISSNIAEGHGGGSRKEYVKFLYYSNRSRCELESQLILAVRLGFADRILSRAIMEKLVSIGKMLTQLIKKLETPQPKTHNPKPKS